MKYIIIVILPLLLSITYVSAQGAGIEWEILNQETVDQYNKGNYDQAVVVAKKALEIAKENVGLYHLDVATSLNNLALIYKAQKREQEANQLYMRAFLIQEIVSEANQQKEITNLNNLASRDDYGDDDNIYMKCGTNIGKKPELFKICADNFPEEYENISTEKYKLCECIIMTMAKNYTYKEFEEFVSIYEMDFLKMMYKDGDETTFSDFEDCILTYVDKDFDMTIDRLRFEEEFMIGCVEELKNNPDMKNINESIYCSCVKDELLLRGFTLSMLSEVEDMNSILFNEVYISCLNTAGISNEFSIQGSDVSGNVNYTSVPLINYGTTFKVELGFGNLSKYFIIDSGASDIMISSSFENDLILENIISRKDYLSDYYYTLADGSFIKCKRILINNVKIGDFTVNNLLVAVIENSNINLLLGKSFLDKFDVWKIDNINSTLYLEK